MSAAAANTAAPLAAARALAGRPDAASRLKQLRETALADASCAPLERQMAELAA